MTRRRNEVMPGLIEVRRDRAGHFMCARQPPRGWYCRRGLHLDGPCALVPRWWNVRGRWQGRLR